MKVDFEKTRQTLIRQFGGDDLKSAKAMKLEPFYFTLESFNPDARLIHERRDKRLHAIHEGTKCSNMASGVPEPVNASFDFSWLLIRQGVKNIVCHFC